MANGKRLIDANALKKAIKSFRWLSPPNTLSLMFSYLRIIINEQPTVDAVEVVHGYWIDSTSVNHMGKITGHGIDCSVCDSVFKDDSREVVAHWKERFKVCPFCGAKMDGERKDNV